MKDVQTHSTYLELSEPAPPALPIGSDLAAQARVPGRSGCDLGAMSRAITGPDGQVVAIEGRADRNAEREDNALRDIALKAPGTVGAHVWTIRFPSHESDGIRHEECTLPICVMTLPHATSLAVWAVPSPVVMGERFRIKVGAK